MKAEVAQQRSLLELSKLDAELSRITHRATHLPEQEACERLQVEREAAGDRLATLRIALEDIDAHVARLEGEIEAVRQREDRDRSLLQSGATDAKQLSDLQHELEDPAASSNQPGGLAARGDGASRGAAIPAGR